MSRANSTDSQSTNSDTYPSTGFAGDKATAHAHRAAKLISEYLKLSTTSKTAHQEFIEKMLYYRPYDFSNLCTAVAVVQKLTQSPRFAHFAEDMELATGAANGSPLLLFSGAYSVAESLNSHAICSDDHVSNLVLSTRTFTRQDICTMSKKLHDFFDWKLEIPSAELCIIQNTLISK